MPPALAVGAAAHANPHDGPIELSRYSLMALVNLAYDCALVQERVGSAGGVELLLEILGSNAASLHAAATTCLSNVVKGHAPNAAAAVRAGAARTLVGLVTDDDGDELSKSAFVTLVALDVDGARDLVDALAEALGRVDDALGRADPHDAAQLHDGLYQLLAVLNGLIYTHQPIGKAVLAAHGLERLLGVLQPCRALPAALRVLAVHALLNVTVSRDKPTQDEARRERAARCEPRAAVVRASGCARVSALMRPARPGHTAHARTHARRRGSLARLGSSRPPCSPRWRSLGTLSNRARWGSTSCARALRRRTLTQRRVAPASPVRPARARRAPRATSCCST